jgi:CubicO group peptidase (beta-lactamase class C family)
MLAFRMIVMKSDPAREIARTLRAAVARREIPGAVCMVGDSRRIRLCAVVGNRMLTPMRRPMRRDTVFDIASLTKVVATTPCVMKLIEQKKISLRDTLPRFLPGLRRSAKKAVTIEHLLLHTSGLPAHRDYWKRARSNDSIIAMCLAEPLLHRPGERFEYSDLGFILLGEIVRRAAGEPLPDFAARNVFAPVGMSSSLFNPPPALRPRCAATEMVKGKPLCGRVHDENARAMGGAAGHAGLFSTADDLARFCQWVLRHRTDGAIRTLIRPRAVPGGWRRTLGWDVATTYSPRGHLFGPRSFGHTGFTGCSLWLDPDRDAFVVLLTNRVHLGRDVDICGLRSRIGTYAALFFLCPPKRLLDTTRGRR